MIELAGAQAVAAILEAKGMTVERYLQGFFVEWVLQHEQVDSFKRGFDKMVFITFFIARRKFR